jgi:hypothetical protein
LVSENREEHTLRVFENRVFRSISPPKRVKRSFKTTA